MAGFTRAMDDAAETSGISAGLIMCFLRHLPPEDAGETLYQAEPFVERLLGVGLESSEVGNPPQWFTDAYRLAREAGLHTVAHAGEEGPPQYITNALEILEVERIDHGVRGEEDSEVVDTLVRDQIPLTMCPLSNVKLNVFDTIEDHNLKRLLDLGVMVTVNSDDPAYFGGYILDNYLAVATGLHLTRAELVTLARNSIEASFIGADEKTRYIQELERVVDSSQ
jgi:adenosine deaminase